MYNFNEIIKFNINAMINVPEPTVSENNLDSLGDLAYNLWIEDNDQFKVDKDELINNP